MGAKRKIESIEKPAKTRKVTSGLLRDKSRTMARMVAAVGKVIQKKGYAGLDAASVSRECGLDKKLVWTYFGGLDNLVEEFINQRDFWKHVATDTIRKLVESDAKIGPKEVNGLLQNQLDTLLKDKTLQKIIHWELGEKNKLLRKVSDKREEIGKELLDRLEGNFKKDKAGARAILALTIGGIYYMSLHGKNNGSLFCGIDINTEEGKERISEAIKFVVYCMYEKMSK